MLYNLLKEIYSNSLEKGDHFIIDDYSDSKVVNSIESFYINDRYYKYKCTKIPFNKTSDSLTEEQISIIVDLYNKNLNSYQKKVYKNFINYIKLYKTCNRTLYFTYLKIRNLEFIPKTLKHLKIMHNAFYYK